MLKQVAAAATSVSKAISEPKTAMRSTVSTVARINIVARVIPNVPYGTIAALEVEIRWGRWLMQLSLSDELSLCADCNVKQYRGTRSTTTDGWMVVELVDVYES